MLSNIVRSRVYSHHGYSPREDIDLENPSFRVFPRRETGSNFIALHDLSFNIKEATK